MRIRSLTVFTLWLTCATTSVQASPAEIFEFDAKSSALGGAMVASSDDYTAAFYNPGALTRSQHVSTGLGISAALPALKFEQVSVDIHRHFGSQPKRGHATDAVTGGCLDLIGRSPLDLFSADLTQLS